MKINNVPRINFIIECQTRDAFKKLIEMSSIEQTLMEYLLMICFDIRLMFNYYIFFSANSTYGEFISEILHNIETNLA